MPFFTTLNSMLSNSSFISTFFNFLRSHHRFISGSFVSEFAGFTRSCTSQRIGLKPNVFQSVIIAMSLGLSVR